MGKPTFDSRNSKTLGLITRGVLGFDQIMEDAMPRGFGFPVIKRRYETSE